METIEIKLDGYVKEIVETIPYQDDDLFIRYFVFKDNKYVLEELIYKHIGNLRNKVVLIKDGSDRKTPDNKDLVLLESYPPHIYKRK